MAYWQTFQTDQPSLFNKGICLFVHVRFGSFVNKTGNDICCCLS
jgi:hypothetical protein